MSELLSYKNRLGDVTVSIRLTELCLIVIV